MFTFIVYCHWFGVSSLHSTSKKSFSLFLFFKIFMLQPSFVLLKYSQWYRVYREGTLQLYRLNVIYKEYNISRKVFLILFGQWVLDLYLKVRINTQAAMECWDIVPGLCLLSLSGNFYLIWPSVPSQPQGMGSKPKIFFPFLPLPPTTNYLPILSS